MQMATARQSESVCEAASDFDLISLNEVERLPSSSFAFAIPPISFPFFKHPRRDLGDRERSWKIRRKKALAG
jgi:hypothetical protein